MPVERINSFPQEPLRRSSGSAVPAMEHAVNKDGQQYFWELPIDFPDAWRVPNEQIDIFSYLRKKPKESTQPKDKQLYFWERMPYKKFPDFVIDNQEHWLGIDRGKLPKTKPLLFNHSAEALHERIIRTFDVENPVKPVLTWSVLLDRPDEPTSSFMHAIEYPTSVEPEDRDDYSYGIERIAEFATNLAAKEFFKQNMTFPGGEALGKVYGEFSDYMSYKLLLGGTYRNMSHVEHTAQKQGKNFKEAVLAGLFQHDFEPLNELIKDTGVEEGIEKWQNINDITDLAVHLGKTRLKKPDLSKWLRRLEMKSTDSERRANVKNFVISLLAGGVYRNPGVTELSGCIQSFVLIESMIAYFAIVANEITQTEAKVVSFVGAADLLAKNAALTSGVVGSIMPFIAVHESIHHYSSNNEYMGGFIPAHIIEKKGYPGVSELENSDQ